MNLRHSGTHHVGYCGVGRIARSDLPRIDTWPLLRCRQELRHGDAGDSRRSACR